MKTPREAKMIVCPYCRDKVAHVDSQRDHVPPRSLFDDPPPDNLITVRCCAKCHTEHSEGDDILKLLVVGSKLRRAPSEEKRASIERCLGRNPWWGKDYEEAVVNRRHKIIACAEGLREGVIIEFGASAAKAIDETIRRIAIGLLFHDEPSYDASSKIAEIIYAPAEKPEEFFYELEKIGPLPHNLKVGEEDFTMSWFFDEDSRKHCMLYLSFYGAINCVVSFHP